MHSHPLLNPTMKGTTPNTPLSWDFCPPNLLSVTVKKLFKPVVPPGARDRPMEVTYDGLPISMAGAFNFVCQVFLLSSPYLYVHGFDPYMCFLSFRTSDTQLVCLGSQIIGPFTSTLLFKNLCELTRPSSFHTSKSSPL
jgi:hypothetical protein